MNTLRWHIYAPAGELIAATRYACDAAKLASCNGPGTTVRHGTRVVLTVSEDSSQEGALPLADAMIAAAYRRPAA